MAGQGPAGPATGAGGGSQDPGASLAAALLAAVARQRQRQELVAMARAPGPSLSEVLKPEVLAPLLQDPEVRGLPCLWQNRWFQGAASCRKACAQVQLADN